MFGYHHNNNDFIEHPLVETNRPSISLIAIAPNITAFTMIGRGSNYKVANFSFRNLKISEAVNENSSRTSTFLYLTTGGAPERVCIIEECTFWGLNYCVHSLNTQNTSCGNLTISKCNVNFIKFFVYCEATSYTGTVTNFLLENSNIENCYLGGTLVTILNAFGNIRIINNILEDYDHALNIGLVYHGTITIEDNYFESFKTNHSRYEYDINIRPKDPGLTTLKMNNYHNENAVINVWGCIVKEANFERYSDQCSFSRCFINCDTTHFKLKWIGGDCKFANYKLGVPSNIVGDFTTRLYNNIVGRPILTTLTEFTRDLEYNAGDVVYVGFYFESAADWYSVSIYTLNDNQGLSRGNETYGYCDNFKGLMVVKIDIRYEVAKALCIKTKYAANIAGVQIVDENANPSDILIPCISNILPAGLPTFDKPVGFTSIYNYKLVTWTGSKWVYADGTDVS